MGRILRKDGVLFAEIGYEDNLTRSHLHVTHFSGSAKSSMSEGVTSSMQSSTALVQCQPQKRNPIDPGF